MLLVTAAELPPPCPAVQQPVVAVFSMICCKGLTVPRDSQGTLQWATADCVLLYLVHCPCNAQPIHWHCLQQQQKLPAHQAMHTAGL